MAITSVYSVIAVWMPVTVVPTSSATVAIATFITELSSVIRNCPAASVTSTDEAACAAWDCTFELIPASGGGLADRNRTVEPRATGPPVTQAWVTESRSAGPTADGDEVPADAAGRC